MGNASGISRGDRNRNARLARLRALVPVENAIVGIDLADKKQMVVVTDHDSRVLARRTFRCRAWDLGQALDWAAGRAVARGFAGVTVACEPTGHRWRVVGRLAADRGMPMVCVQPLQMSWARRGEDLTFDTTDDKDAVLIARLTAQLRCYVPEPVDEPWGRLRHLGARREQLPETGDPRRFTTARAMVKHAGLAPREKLSGSFVGRTKLTGQGRPLLRLAAWRAVWAALKPNPVYAARYRHLTGREQNKLRPTQAQTVMGAAVLRQLHAVVTTGRAWDPDIAVHGTRHRRQPPIAA